MTERKGGWFGKKQFVILIFCAGLFFIQACVNSGTTNTILPLISELRGWDYANLLPFMSYGGYIGAVAAVFCGFLVMKRGPMFVIVPCLILEGITLMVYGSTTIYVIFVVTIILNRVLSCGYQWSGGAALLNTWFPRTKGIVLGWATMGILMTDIVWSPYIPKAMTAFGSGKTMLVAGCCVLAVAILGLIFVKNTPEEAGAFPDNDPQGAEEAAKQEDAIRKYKSSFTVKKLLVTKQFWAISIGWGVLWLVAVAFVSQVVLRAVSLGYTQEYAVRLLQISTIASLFGSWLFGFFDLKIGTKKATQVFAVCSAVLFVLGLLQGMGSVILWISVCGMMACAGGIANLEPSMVGTVFGRWDFAPANRLIAPIVMAISSSSFLVVAVFLNTPWGREGLYAFGIICSVICLIIVSLTSDKCIGAKDDEVTELIRERN